MAMRLCTEPDCDRPYRARGLCSMHWKRTFGVPDTYTKECGWCGTSYTTRYRRGRACSVQHGQALAGRIRLLCDVPETHPSRSTLVPTDHPSREVEWYVPPWPVWYGNCAECGCVFVCNNPTKVHCSRHCARRVERRLRRGREFGEGDTYTWPQVVRLHLAFGGCCAYCWEPNEDLQPDHVIPLSRGGHNTISNILPCCRPCNTDKRNLTPEEWAADRFARGKPVRVTEWMHDSRYHHLALREARPLSAAA